MIASGTSTTLLTYALTTDPDPLQVSLSGADPSYGALTIVVSNSTTQPIYCNQIQFSFPIGDLAQDLTNVSTGIHSAASPSTWQIAQTADGVFTATPVKPEDNEITTEGLVFVIYHIVVNEQVGTFTVTVQETSSLDNSNFQVTTGSYDLGKFPYGFFFGNLAPSAPQVQHNQQVTLTWIGSDGPTYTMFAGTQAFDVTELRTWPSPQLTSDTTFLLQASLQTGTAPVTAYQSTTVIVADPSLTATDLTVLTTSALEGAVTVGTTGTGANLTVNGAATASGALTSSSGTSSLANLNVPGTATAGTLTGTTLNSPSAALTALTVSGSLTAKAAAIAALCPAAQGIGAGTYTATTDGFVVGFVACPAQTNRCDLCVCTITLATGGMSIQFMGGNGAAYDSGGSGWCTPMNEAGMLPVASGNQFSVSVYQDSHNEVSAPTAAWFVPIGAPPGYQVVSEEQPLVEEAPTSAPFTTAAGRWELVAVLEDVIGKQFDERQKQQLFDALRNV